MHNHAFAFMVGFALLGQTPMVSADCHDLIGAVEVALDGVEIHGRNAAKDRAGLEGKLAAASDKLDQGKLDDAIQKLMDFQSKVQQLAGGKKMSQDDADMLSAKAQAAIDCIDAL